MMAETSTAAAATRGNSVGNVRVEAKSDASIIQPEQRLCIRPPDARQFLNDLVPGARLHRFAFQTFSDRKGGDRRLARTLFGTFDEVAQTLVDLNRSGAGVFVALNEFRADAPARTNENVVGYRACWLDLDGAPLEPVLQGAVPPHVVNQTSPGRWHCFWRIADDTHATAWRAVQASLAERFDGDTSMTKPCGVMRLPGFIHQKSKPFHVETVQRIEHAEPIDPLAAFGVDVPAASYGEQRFAEPIVGAIGDKQSFAEAIVGPIGDGHRNVALTSLAGTMRDRGCEGDEILALLRVTNAKRCELPLPERELQAIVSSVMRYPPGKAWWAEADAEDAAADAWLETQGEAFRRWVVGAS